MSLIHDALKEMDRSGTRDVAASLPPVTTRSSAFAPVVIAFVAVLAAGGVAYAGWRMVGDAPAVAAAPIPAAVVALPVATLPVVTLPPPMPVPLLVPLPVPAPDVVVVAATEVPVRAAVRTAAPVPKTDAVPVPPRHAEVTGDPVSAEHRFALFLEAMRVKDMTAAESQLVGLRRLLTRSSISLVRAEAWFAYARGDAATARREYQEVIDRMPGDEEASINLASMEAAQQQTETARQILSDALRANPESEALKATLATFGGRR